MNFILDVTIVEEAGYISAMRGLSFNKKQDKDMHDVAVKLSKMDSGHNKFLESMVIWLEVKAPRYFWQEADTYRLTSKQSESTMHTLLKEVEMTFSSSMNDIFEDGSITEQQFEAMKKAVKIEDSQERLIEIKRLLPEGFLQKRMWRLDYKTLRNIILQRKNHRLPHWKKFIEEVLKQIQHPEFLN